ncbi:unnamed protein product [Lactuca saligna]|uniref:Uncharacterized protein n=1 Tax=Lactuca saligna TaxID=75948 RepID=A0AA35Y5T9_LACSI|nr:unnamed protein product [Lactuca saligna]
MKKLDQTESEELITRNVVQEERCSKPRELGSRVQEAASPNEEGEHLSAKGFIAKKEEFEEWVEEKETSEDEGLNVKGLMDLINDAPDGGPNSLDANVTKGPHAPDSPIVIQANNMAFSDIQSTLSKYVSSTIRALSILILKPLPEPLETINLGLLSMKHLFELLYVFPNLKTIPKPLLKIDSSLFFQDSGWKYLSGVIGKFLRHKTGSLDQLNLFEQRILYAMTCNKRLDFAQIFFDQLVECITGSKKATYVPYPHCLAPILVRNGEGYNANHGVTIPIPVLS